MSRGLEALPHQIPFRAVSSIAAVDDRSARGLFLPTFDDALRGVSSELMLVEAMAQVGGSVVFREPGARGFLFGADEVEIHRTPQPGDRILIEVCLEAELTGLFRLRGTARLGDTLLGSARFFLAAQTESSAGSNEES